MLSTAYEASLRESKRAAKRAAKELGYEMIDKRVCKKIDEAKNVGEINTLMRICREKL